MHIRTKFLSVIAALTLVSGGALAVSPAAAQFGGLGLGDIGKVVGLPSLNDLISGPKPVTTNIKDAVYGDASLDSFTPPVAAQPMHSLPRDKNGGFVLASGFYEYHAQSYCLHAGTHGPGGGDGYLYAPVKGSAKAAVETILQNSVKHPEIGQKTIQALLWAIVARAKFEDLNTELKFAAAQLLSKKQLATLNRNALSVLTSNEFAQITGGAPTFVRQVLQAESDIRRFATAPTLAYADMERAAVLTGAVPMGEGSVQTPSGRWSRHPDGYLVRYNPSGYSHTFTQIYVEPGSKAIGKVYDPALQIAVPGNTARQRLAQSARIYAN